MTTRIKYHNIIRMGIALTIIGLFLSIRSYVFASDFPSVFNLTCFTCDMTKSHEFGPDFKITNLQSSNPSVMTASVKKNNGSVYLVYSIKKTGTSVITFNGTFEGETESYKQTVKVKVYKYSNPFKRIKVGKQNITSKFKKAITAKVKPLKGKVEL